MNKFVTGFLIWVALTLWPFNSLAEPPTTACPIKEVASTKDCRSAECNVACMWAGYDGGTHKNGSCYCYDAKPIERMKGKRVTLPKLNPQ